MPAAPSDRLTVGYVAWVYPEISQTFVQREVAALRADGVEVHTTAVRPPSDAERTRETGAGDDTWTILPVPLRRVLLGHLRALLRGPSAYASALREAWRGRAPRTSGRDLLTPLFYFAEAVLLAEHLRRVRVRHLHAHFADVGCEVARLVAHLERARGRDFTWSFTLHGPGELLDPQRFRLALKVEQADLVVAISEYCRAQVVALVAPEHWSKVSVVHCGLDVDGWPRRATAPAAGPLRLLTVGRLHPQKSHHVLVQAVGLLRDRGVDVDLTLVGQGEDRESLEALVDRLRLADRVHLVGAQGQAEVRALLQGADAFCLASVSEGLPVVLMEAMATGLPVVTTRITGVPELVEDGVSGLLVPPARPDLLADALQRLVEEPGLRDRLAEAGLQAVRDGFDSADNARRLAGLFRQVRSTTGPWRRPPARV